MSATTPVSGIAVLQVILLEDRVDLVQRFEGQRVG